LESDILGLGDLKIYAGGWKTDKDSYYSYKNNIDVDNNIVLDLINKMFENKLYGYTFFVHNLGKFDSLYLINGISNSLKDVRYEVKGKWKSEEGLVNY